MSDGGFGYSGSNSVYSGFTQAQTAAPPVMASVVTGAGNSGYRGNYSSGGAGGGPGSYSIASGYSGGHQAASDSGSGGGGGGHQNTLAVANAAYNTGLQHGAAMITGGTGAMGFPNVSSGNVMQGQPSGFPGNPASGVMGQAAVTPMGEAIPAVDMNRGEKALPDAFGGIPNLRGVNVADVSGAVPAAALGAAAVPRHSQDTYAALTGNKDPTAYLRYLAGDPSAAPPPPQGIPVAQPVEDTAGRQTEALDHPRQVHYAETVTPYLGVDAVKLPGMTGDRATATAEVDPALGGLKPTPLLQKSEPAGTPLTVETQMPEGGPGIATPVAPAYERSVSAPSGRARLVENPTSPTSALGEAARSNALTVAQTPVATEAEVPTPQVRPGMPNMKIGSSGPDVSSLQQQLVNAGYLKQSQVDGTFGRETAAAVRKLEADPNVTLSGARLKRDAGVVGPQVSMALRTVPTAGPDTGLTKVASEAPREAIKGTPLNRLGDAQVATQPPLVNPGGSTRFAMGNRIIEAPGSSPSSFGQDVPLAGLPRAKAVEPLSPALSEVSRLYDPNGATPARSPFAAPAVTAKTASTPDFTEASGGTRLKVPGAATPAEAKPAPGGGVPATPAAKAMPPTKSAAANTDDATLRQNINAQALAGNVPKGPDGAQARIELNQRAEVSAQQLADRSGKPVTWTDAQGQTRVVNPRKK